MTLTDFLLARIAEDEATSLSGRHGKPDRIARECEAKRRIVEEHELIRAAYPGTTVETDPCCSTCSAGGEYPGDGYPCPTLRALATVYSDHPDHRDEWRP
jgi:hypothetical protein